MSVQNGERLATKQDLADMYQGILPYLGGMPEMVANKFSKGDLYSTDEKMIGQWTDGKPLYQKVLQKSFSQISDTTRHWVTLFTTSDGMPSNIDFGVVKEQWLQPSISSVSDFDSPTSMPIVDYDNGIRLFCDAKVNKTTNTIVALSNYPQWINSDSFVITVVLNYTKTTDSPISIGNDTDYSTDEKIVGTWIDGKPVYQKTVDCGANPSGANDATEIYDLTSLNYENCWIVNGHIRNTSTGFLLTMPRLVPTNMGYSFNVEVNDGLKAICFHSGANVGIYGNIYVTLQYTKTTD